MSVTIEQLQADLAARDALIGELRRGLQRALEEEMVCRPAWFSALLARTPTDAGAEIKRVNAGHIALIEAQEAELARLRTDLSTAIHNHETVLQREGALRAQLASAEGLVREFRSGHLWLKDRAEMDYLRARLRAITEAVKTNCDILENHCQFYLESDDERGQAAIAAIRAACSSDLPPHPDTERLDWLDRNAPSITWAVIPPGYGWFAKDSDTGTTLRAAVDAARAQAGKKRTT